MIDIGIAKKAEVCLAGFEFRHDGKEYVFRVNKDNTIGKYNYQRHINEEHEPGLSVKQPT